MKTNIHVVHPVESDFDNPTVGYKESNWFEYEGGGPYQIFDPSFGDDHMGYMHEAFIPAIESALDKAGIPKEGNWYGSYSHYHEKIEDED